MLNKVEGIVLRTTDYGETHKIITVYTEELGKVALMARGAKKPKSRFAAACQPYVQAVFVFNQSRGMGSLSSADIVNSFRYIRSDLMKTAYASYAVELLDKLTEDREPNPPLYDLLSDIFLRMNDEGEEEILIRIFETKMLYTTGAAPVLHACVNCGNMEEPLRFSLSHAGVLCRDCIHLDKYPLPVGPQAVKLMRLFQQLNLARLGKISVKPETKKQLQLLLEAYYDEYVGVYVKAKRFLKQMEDLENRQVDKDSDFT
ncbi:DNA repair protein RecO [Alkalicoccus daliensis]|uniref:DNA repair protein RecO n=1 Tax=Alkalicoccus daliensis TaxID=745820 RepID=A0A1H0BC95_9BACI|nr:DNA repair protein RecO [Alkalicoccus daliensis]SDN43294.1 DNA replication and repair protein RecO [Alkalicoccus daliensis]